jgi:hypothetical protein
VCGETARSKWGGSAGIESRARPNGLWEDRGKFRKITGLSLHPGPNGAVRSGRFRLFLCSTGSGTGFGARNTTSAPSRHCDWIRRFIIFHDKRHPSGLGAADVAAFATHLLESGYAIQSVQELLGHSDVRTTMVCAHVFNRGGRAVVSPLDG